MRYLYFVTVLLVLSACSQSSSYKISGVCRDRQLEGKNIYMRKMTSHTPSDSACIRNSRFSFAGQQPSPEIHILYVEVENGMYNMLPVAVEAGKIKVVLDSIIYTGGTPLNDKLQDFILAKQTFVLKEGAGKSKDELPRLFSAFLKKQILGNSDNIVSQYIYQTYLTKLTNEDKKEILERSDIALLEKIQRLK